MEFYIERIRGYSVELTSTVNKLLKQLSETAALLTENDVKAMIASQGNCLFVARRLDNREIVGMLTLIIFRIPFAKKALIEDLVVDKEYRKKGIGTKLILSAITEARRRKVSYLDFTSNPKRVAANRLYQSLGFKKRDTNVYRIEL